MKSITTQQAADCLQFATIIETTTVGSMLIQKCHDQDGKRFITVDDASGKVLLITSV